mmetsp:Transcript_45697/g.99559  ORF Transcript_45697/g.99559 Transcript_45697/m.99559 type:complete len:263 (+) Transcript_45697:1160-1948(+)
MQLLRLKVFLSKLLPSTQLRQAVQQAAPELLTTQPVSSVHLGTFRTGGGRRGVGRVRGVVAVVAVARLGLHNPLQGLRRRPLSPLRWQLQAAECAGKAALQRFQSLDRHGPHGAVLLGLLQQRQGVLQSGMNEGRTQGPRGRHTIFHTHQAQGRLLALLCLQKALQRHLDGTITGSTDENSALWFYNRPVFARGQLLQQRHHGAGLSGARRALQQVTAPRGRTAVHKYLSNSFLLQGIQVLHGITLLHQLFLHFRRKDIRDL